MYDEFISFLKRYDLYNKKIIDNFFNSAFRYSYKTTDDMNFSECIYIIDDNNVLVKIRACIPYINDYKTLLINIHEYVHYYMMYKKLGKEVIIGRNCELLPMVYEKLFILEKNSKELNDYDKLLMKQTEEDNDPDYIYALENRDKVVHFLYSKKRGKK